MRLVACQSVSERIVIHISASTRQDSLLKLQVGSLEQQLKVLKAKVISRKEEKGKALSDLYGIFERKMDLSLEEIKRCEYSYKEASV